MLGECGTNMAMTGRTPRRPRPPLDVESLQSLALRYVERFATSRAKLASYLQRKLIERGWGGERPADVERLVERFAELGYVDDRSFALSKARSLGTRGYGARRVQQALQQAGISEEDRGEANQQVADDKVESALRFARRKRLGPFAVEELDRAAREKALAAMLRAGHRYDLARAIVQLEPGAEFDRLNLG